MKWYPMTEAGEIERAKDEDETSARELIESSIVRLRQRAVDKARGILAAAANSKGDPMMIAEHSDEWQVCDELERLEKQLKAANRAAHMAAVKWWKRHCASNKNMELTKEAHLDLCAVEQATRQTHDETTT